MNTGKRVSPACDYLICRSRRHDRYVIYRFDPDAPGLLVEVSVSPGRFHSGWRMAQVGGYLLQWTPRVKVDGTPGYRYALRRFDPEAANPFDGEAVQSGFWKQEKFWGYRAYYSDDPDEGHELDLLSLGSFVMHLIPAKGRGTFELWNFDPCPNEPDTADPLPAPYTGQGGFPTIRAGHELLAVGNYVLDRSPDRRGFRLWSFDPQRDVPLSLPAVQEGRWETIDARHELTVLGKHVFDWCPEDGRYRLWRVDPECPEVLVGPLREGTLPDGIDTDTILTAFQARRPIDVRRAEMPGTLDFMRSKIRHVVYYMLESRSFDNVCGWLYEQGETGYHTIGTSEPFDGASTADFNLDGDRKVHVSQFKDGRLSEDWDLIALDQDPFHNTTDSIQQMFVDPAGYYERSERPDMGGFILNNANDQVMRTFSPEQLPVLNGLARHFAVSDRWFSSIPGGTDVNRAFSVTGSAFDRLGTWEGGNAYKYWPFSPHRQSIWKLLWSHGETDWKIYNAVRWQEEVFTYQLYLKGQVPSIDADPSRFIADIDQFKQDARSGDLPAFSYLEPAWIAPNGSTSYHPGGDLVPGERALNEIYDAIRNGPGWEHTLLVITFDKNGGPYDHVAPPYARKPWPHDRNDGFAYDLMGPRVPTVMVSPWIRENTVFRAEGEVPFDSTSFAATLLRWYGIPRPTWKLGDRIEAAPTFETVFQASEPRTGVPTLTPPHDKSFPRGDQ